MPRHMTAFALACSVAIVLTACDDKEDPDTETTSEAAPTADASEPDAGTSTAPTGEPDGESTVNASADFYCDAADDGYIAMGALLDATDVKSGETGVEDDGGDVGIMNSAGRDMLAAMSDVVDHWTTAQGRIEDEPWDDADSSVSNDSAIEAFDLYFEYLDVFARPEAQIAAESSTIAEYDTATVALFLEPGAAQAAGEGAAAIGTILEYTIERCGLLPAL